MRNPDPDKRRMMPQKFSTTPWLNAYPETLEKSCNEILSALNNE